MNKKNNFERGYFLIETAVALSLLTVGFLGIMVLVSRSIGLNNVARDQFVANYLAMEGIEVSKNLIDANYVQDKPWNQGFCENSEGDYEVAYDSVNLETNQNRQITFDQNSGFYGYNGGQNLPFVRTIKIKCVVDSTGNNNEIKVNSIVKWTGHGGIKYEINLEDHFFNWRLL